MTPQSPLPGDYGCVRIPWLYKAMAGHQVRIPNFMGYAIRLFTHSHYDHAFIYVGDGKIIEAQPDAAVTSSLSEYGGDAILWSTTDLTQVQRDMIQNKAASLLGTPYGFLDIVYLGLATLGFRFKWLLRRVERQDRLICSQLVALCGETAGVDAWLCGKPNPCLVTPGDLARNVT